MCSFGVSVAFWGGWLQELVGLVARLLIVVIATWSATADGAAVGITRLLSSTLAHQAACCAVLCCAEPVAVAAAASPHARLVRASLVLCTALSTWAPQWRSKC